MDIIATITLVIGQPGETARVSPGSHIQLPDEEAQALIARGFACRPCEKNDRPRSTQDFIDHASNDDHLDDLLDAIESLDDSGFGKDGKPRVKALEAQLGFDISARERDHAWKEYHDVIGESL